MIFRFFISKFLKCRSECCSLEARIYDGNIKMNSDRILNGLVATFIAIFSSSIECLCALDIIAIVVVYILNGYMHSFDITGS